MRRFSAKVVVCAVFALALCGIKNRAFLSQVREAWHYDTFNVFHWRDIRFTNAEPNKNVVKTRYILHNPKKFNAFIFGSSRVGNLPPDGLPAQLDGTPLRWYNMTCSVGTPNDHFMTLKTFLAHGVSVDAVIVGFDEISMYRDAEAQRADLLRMPYQVYEEAPRQFLRAYLQIQTDETIKKQVDEYDRAAHEEARQRFYEWGGNASDFSLTLNPDPARYAIGGLSFSCKEAHKDIENIVRLCSEHGITLVLFSNPLHQNRYRKSVEAGYVDFLRNVAQHCEFYNFSALNAYTQDSQYYYEWSHYRPALGLLVERILFGTADEQEQIRAQAGDPLWGCKVTAQNVDDVVAHLERQLEP